MDIEQRAISRTNDRQQNNPGRFAEDSAIRRQLTTWARGVEPTVALLVTPAGVISAMVELRWKG